MKISLEKIKQLRTKTKAGVGDCRQVLEEAKGDLKKAEALLKAKGLKSAAKREGRETCQGLIEAYTHAGGQVVGVVELLCETDFVAKTEDFKNLAHEMAMQIAAMGGKKVADFLKQNWIRDESKTIDDLLKELIAKTGENITVGRIAQFKLGESKK